jgi:uncharacterized membrane protein
MDCRATMTDAVTAPQACMAESERCPTIPYRRVGGYVAGRCLASLASPDVSDHETEPTAPRRDLLDKTFNVALILKGLDGLLESVGGILLLVISPDTLNQWAHRFTQHELSEDPHDFFARHLLHLTGNLHHTQTFGALYLLTHGIVKLVIVAGLLRREHWAYYVAFVFLGGFVIYQIYRLTYDPSVGLALLTVFDIFIIWLTWREFVRMRRARLHSASALSRPSELELKE